MSRHVIHRGPDTADEFQELPTDEELAPASVTVTHVDGSLHSHHTGAELGGIGFEFADSGILVLRFLESDRLVMAIASGAWAYVTGTALGDRGRRSSRA